MLPAWMGEVIGTLHIHRIRTMDFAKELGVNEKYLYGVLSGKRLCPKDMESRCRETLARMIQED